MRRHSSGDDAALVSVAPLLVYWKLVAALAVVGLVAGLAMSATITKQYEAAALVIVNPPSDPDASAPSLTTFRTLAETAAVAQKVLTDTSLDKPPFHLTPQRFVSEHLFVDEVRGTNLLRVRVRWRDAALAARAANGVANEALVLHQSLTGGGAESLARQLRTQLLASEQRLIDAEKKLGEYRQSAQLELAREDADSRLALRATVVPLLVDIETEKARLAAAQEEIKRHDPVLHYPRKVDTERTLARQLRGTEAAPGLPPRESREEAQQRLPRADTREQRPFDTPTAEIRSESRPPERSAKADVGLRAHDAQPSGVPSRRTPPRRPPESTREAADDFADVDTDDAFVNPVYQVLTYQITNSRTKLAALERRRQELLRTHGVGAAELKQLTGLHQKELQIARLEGDVDLARRIRADLAMQYEEAARRILTRSAGLQVVDRALAPERPNWPKPSIFASGGFLAGALLGAATAFLANFRRRSA